MIIAVEEKRVRSLFERVEAVEEVAETLADDDERRAKLLAVSNAALAEQGNIRPVIAARLPGLSEDCTGVGRRRRADRRPAHATSPAGCAKRARHQPHH